MAKRPLTIYLLKSGTTLASASKPDTKAEAHELREALPFEGRLLIQTSRPARPSWADFVQEGVERRLEHLVNSHASALLLIKASRRLFAITFGYGRSLLRQDQIERRFGLMVLLNRVDADRLYSLDTFVFEDLAVQTRRQTSRAAGVTEFGIDPARDIVRTLIGQPRDALLGKRLAGKDSLTLSVEVEFSGLGNLCSQLLAASRETTYREQFAWVDHVQHIEDPAEIARLNAALIAALKEGPPFEDIYLAPPEPVEWEDVETVRYPGAGGRGTFEDMDLETYVSLIGGPEEVTLEKLKSHRVALLGRVGGHARYEWSIFDCIVYQREENSVYALVGGDWLHADNEFAESVERDLAAIPVRSPADLPDVGAKHKEEDYNKSVAAGNSRIACLDRKLIRLPAGAKVEPCDLFGPDRTFRHVKLRRSSAMLSHLWNQGLVASTLLASSPEFREKLRALLRDFPHLQRTIDVASIDTSTFTVQFVLLGGRRALPGSLPFFSKVTLVNIAKQLTLYRYRVELMQVKRGA